MKRTGWKTGYDDIDVAFHYNVDRAKRERDDRLDRAQEAYEAEEARAAEIRDTILRPAEALYDRQLALYHQQLAAASEALEEARTEAQSRCREILEPANKKHRDERAYAGKHYDNARREAQMLRDRGRWVLRHAKGPGGEVV